MSKWKTSSPPVAPSKGRRKKDIIEPSPNSRAECRNCEQKIMKGSTRIGIQGKIETPQGIQVYRLHYYHDNCVTEETKRKLHTAPSGSKQPPKKRAKKDTNISTSNTKKKSSAAKQPTTINPPIPSTTRQLKPKLQKQLETDLRQLRSCYATAQGNCEEYKIFSNKSLTELTTKLPTNNAELSECWGIKGKRIRQYGKSILQIINMYLDKEQQGQGSGDGRRRVQTTIPMSPPTSRRTSTTSATVNNNSTTSSASVSVSPTAAAAVVTPAKLSAAAVKKEEDTTDDDEEDIVIVGPTISVEEIVRRNVQEAEARGEVLEIL